MTVQKGLIGFKMIPKLSSFGIHINNQALKHQKLQSLVYDVLSMA